MHEKGVATELFSLMNKEIAVEQTTLSPVIDGLDYQALPNHFTDVHATTLAHPDEYHGHQSRQLPFLPCSLRNPLACSELSGGC